MLTQQAALSRALGLLTGGTQPLLFPDLCVSSRVRTWSGFPSCPTLFSTQRAVALFPSPEDLPVPGIEPTSPVALALQADSLPLSHLGSPVSSVLVCINYTVLSKNEIGAENFCVSRPVCL